MDWQATVEKMKGGIATLVYCESKAARDKYWPGDGSGSEEWSGILQKMQPLLEEMGKLGTYTTVFTEWLIL